MNGIEILLSDGRGQFIPRDFAEACLHWKISRHARKILMAGPTHELYWEAWDDVVRESRYKDSRGNVWKLYQDGDLFAYCEELMTDEEYADFFGAERPREDRSPEASEIRDLLVQLNRKLDRMMAKVDAKVVQIESRLNSQNLF